MSNAPRAIDTWVYGVLAADPTLQTATTGGTVLPTRIYDTQAPEGTPYPYGVFHAQDLPANQCLGPSEFTMQALYTIQWFVAGAAYSTLDPLVDRTDTLLQTTPSTPPSGAQIVGCRRDRWLKQAFNVGGKVYRAKGAIYRVWCEPS